MVGGWRWTIGHAAIAMPIAEMCEAGCTRGVSRARWAAVRGLGADAGRCWVDRGGFGRLKGKGLLFAPAGERKKKNSKAEVWRQRSGGNQFSVDLAAALTDSVALTTIPRAAVSLRYGSDRMVKFCAENQKEKETWGSIQHICIYIYAGTGRCRENPM